LLLKQIHFLIFQAVVLLFIFIILVLFVATALLVVQLNQVLYNLLRVNAHLLSQLKNLRV
jgi:hypothetical protein